MKRVNIAFKDNTPSNEFYTDDTILINDKTVTFFNQDKHEVSMEIDRNDISLIRIK